LRRLIDVRFDFFIIGAPTSCRRCAGILPALPVLPLSPP
jgi:hypothetical protein